MKIKISKKAVEKFEEACDQNNLNSDEVYIRAFIQSGGTAGLSIEKDKKSTDYLVKTKGVRIVVDKTSAAFLEGAEIGYQTGGGNKGFTIKMPAMTLPACNGCDGNAGCCA